MSQPFIPAIRDPLDIQYAHDMLANIVTGQVDISELPPMDRRLLVAALDVLCWALKHDHNTRFESNLKELREAFKTDAPFTLEDLRRKPFWETISFPSRPR